MPDTFATVILARVSAEPGAPAPDTLRWSDAGHPPPIPLAPDGRARLPRHPPELPLGTR